MFPIIPLALPLVLAAPMLLAPMMRGQNAAGGDENAPQGEPNTAPQTPYAAAQVQQGQCQAPMYAGAPNVPNQEG